MLFYQDAQIIYLKGGFLMSEKGNKQKFVNIAGLGNFTKNAVENFEENIVNQKDYLEKVKDSEETKTPNKFE